MKAKAKAVVVGKASTLIAAEVVLANEKSRSNWRTCIQGLPSKSFKYTSPSSSTKAKADAIKHIKNECSKYGLKAPTSIGVY